MGEYHSSDDENGIPVHAEVENDNFNSDLEITDEGEE